MIEIRTRIHDKFSVEFKVGFVVDHGIRANDFAINSWIFIPNSLGIDPSTYDKEQFYRDVKSNVRLITPVFLLSDIAHRGSIPVERLRMALENLAAVPTREHVADYEYHIKMFSAIVKSSLRDEALRIERAGSPDDAISLADAMAEATRDIIRTYRSMRRIINTPDIPAEVANYYALGDEFMSHIIESYSFRIIARIDRLPSDERATAVRAKVAELVRAEGVYKAKAGYPTPTDDDASNRDIVYRHRILKKYIESDLYIKLDKKQDGRTVKQVYYAIAAGIAMIFATVVAFTAQQRFGSFSMPLFVALVVSYMLKDRIKDLARYYFAHKLGKKYFDNKAAINIKEQEVGWMKEGADFITDDKTPSQVLEIRERSAMLEAENRIFDEKIILYRKLVYIDSEKLRLYNDYNLSGINDILRLQINSFTRKMDDPQVPLRKLGPDGSVETLYTEKIYYINIVLQIRFEDEVDYKRFRIVATRDGIREVQELL